MGFGGISIWQLLIVLAIIILLFGTKKLRNIGTDLGNAVKGFKKAISNEDKNEDKSDGLSKSSLENENEEALKAEKHEEKVRSKETVKRAAEK